MGIVAAAPAISTVASAPVTYAAPATSVVAAAPAISTVASAPVTYGAASTTYAGAVAPTTSVVAAAPAISTYTAAPAISTVGGGFGAAGYGHTYNGRDRCSDDAADADGRARSFSDADDGKRNGHPSCSNARDRWVWNASSLWNARGGKRIRHSGDASRALSDVIMWTRAYAIGV